MTGAAAFRDHLASGITSVCRCWSVTRTDGEILGFTDHDRLLRFEGIDFRADGGLTARTLQQTTGLSVDNSEALGVLSDPAITEPDIEAGRFDGAEVRAWLVNWRNPSERVQTFRGRIGEISRTGSAFRAELRGLADCLNQPRGRVFHGRCPAVLGDGQCRIDTASGAHRHDAPILSVSGGRTFEIVAAPDHDAGWFRHGVLTILDGEAAGLFGIIRKDRIADGRRILSLWEALRAPIGAGDRIRLTAGCDKRASTCKSKFNNMLNFRGFPAIPGEDWLMSYPRNGGGNDGGKLR